MFLHNILEVNVLKSLVKVLMTKGLQLLIGLLSKYHLPNEQINLEIFPPMKSIPLTSHDYRENEITHRRVPTSAYAMRPAATARKRMSKRRQVITITPPRSVTNPPRKR